MLVSNEILYKGEKYSFMALDVALSHIDIFAYPFLVPINDDTFVMIEYHDSQVDGAIKKYKEKGLKALLLKEEHYFEFLTKIRSKMKSTLEKARESASPEDFITNFEEYHNVVADALGNFGINKVTINLAREMSEQVVKASKKVNLLFNMISSFKNRCKSEYIKSMCVSYLATMMLDKCAWSSSQIQEKLILGILLSDSTLKRQDFALLEQFRLNDQKGPRLELPIRLINHPTDVAKMLKGQGLAEKETLTVIEEHHELPDGTGFPKKLNSHSISPLSAIHIVSRHFVDKVFLKPGEPIDLDQALLAIYDKFYNGNFKQACSTLFQVMGKEKGTF